MPRTVQDILDHADELAKRFEDYEPSPTDERDPIRESLQKRPGETSEACLGFPSFMVKCVCSREEIAIG